MASAMSASTISLTSCLTVMTRRQPSSVLALEGLPVMVPCAQPFPAQPHECDTIIPVVDLVTKHRLVADVRDLSHSRV